MPIRFYCTACHKPLSIGTRKAGTRIACPQCKGEVVVPPKSDPEVAIRIPVSQPAGPPPATLPATPARAPAAPPPTRRPFRLRRIVIAAVMFVGVVGTFVVALGASLRDRPDRQPREERQPPVSTPVVSQREPVPTETGDRPEEINPASLPLAFAAAKAPPPEPHLPLEDTASEDRVRAGGPLFATGPSPAKPGSAEAAKKRADAVAERWRSKRRSQLSDEELRRQLLLVPEVKLDAVPGSSKGLIAASAQVAAAGRDVVPAFMTRRLDLIGMRSRTGNDARMSKEEALNLKVLSQHLRLHLETSMTGIKEGVLDPRPDPQILRERLLDSPQWSLWLRPEAIPALRQLLMHEHKNVRQILVEALAKIPGPQATRALAERALFDLHPDVRLAALVALGGRPAHDYVPVLLAGFRYPWPPIADHAAEALVALEARDAVPRLIPLLDARDLSEPYPVEAGKKRLTMVPELVRLNHLRNCLLCHFPSFSPLDPIRGQVPNSAHKLPLPASGSPGGSGGGGGWGGGGGGGGGGGWGKKNGKSKFTTAFDWVRPDITYLKQDFSVLQPVPDHGRQWPADQRFDFLVRLRPLDKKELQRWQETPAESRSAPPQREAVLFALRELTGEDPGPAAADWQRLYSPVTGRRLDKPLEAKDRAQYLTTSLVEAAPPRQAELLVMFKERAGQGYDTAVAQAVPELSAELQKAGRTVLADRMQCLPLKDLRERLRDKDPEVRRAAIRASRLREEKAVVPGLIDLLDDSNAEVAKQALLALRQLTVRDFGPPAGAVREQRVQAMAAWREWWQEQERKRAEQKQAGS